MAQVLIRNLEDDAVFTLKARASLADVSFESYLRDAIHSLARSSGRDPAATIAAIRAGIRRPDGAPSTQSILDDAKNERDERHTPHAKRA